MRSTNAFRWSLANRVAGSSLAAAAVAIDHSSVDGRRFEIRACRVKADGKSSTSAARRMWRSMFLTGLCEGGELRRRGVGLVLGLPLLERHAVDGLAALVLGHRHATSVGGVLDPIGKTVATEAGEIHQVDVLHVGARTQVLDQPAERGCLERGAGVLIDRHERGLFIFLPLASLPIYIRAASRTFQRRGAAADGLESIANRA